MRKAAAPIGFNKKGPSEESGEMAILPSTSTFTLSGKDDKPEKLKKKAKNFLDERQKIKSRAQSLWSFIDATNSFDQVRFFQEHAEQIFFVVYETCMHQIEKIKSKAEKPQSWNSKGLVDLQKTLLLLRKIFLFVPELMRNGWQRHNIAKLLTHILDHGNHPRLRQVGFHLLLLWLNDQVVEYPECMQLFSNAIPLDVFVLDEIESFSTFSNASSSLSEEVEEEVKDTKLHGLQFVKKLTAQHDQQPSELHNQSGLARDERIKALGIELNQTPIGNEHPLYPNPNQPTFNDSIALIHVFISNLIRLAYVASGSPPPPDEYDYPPGDQFEADDAIATGVGIDAATASAKFLFKIFRTYYITKFVPLISKSLNVEGASNNNKTIGFPNCPPSILRSLLRFLIGYCLDNNNKAHLPNAPRYSSPATPILKSIVLSSHETREMLHELLRQSLVLPVSNPNYRDITRGAIHILGVWILGNEEERPSFLRRSSSATSVTSHHSSDEPISEYTDANTFLRRYLLMIKLIFEEDKKLENRDAIAAGVQRIADWEGLVSLYKDAINVYRAITVSKSGMDIEWESWELLLQCLLEIQQWFMSQPEKHSRIPVQALAEDLADFIWETLLHAFVRAKIVHLELWNQLKVHIVSSLRWTQTLNQWVKIMHKLTKLLSFRLYLVDYDISIDKLDQSSSNNNESVNHRHSILVSNLHRNSSSNTNPTGASNGNNKSKVRSRHLSMQSRGGHSPKRGINRPLSATGGSEGQIDTSSKQPPSSSSGSPISEDASPLPEGSMSTMLRNISSASLSDLANTFKPDRKSTHLTEEDDEHAKQKFGIKNITGSFSNTPSSHSITSNSSKKNPPAVGGRRTISIQQLDTLWQDSGSKLLNFVHHAEPPVKPEWDKKSESSTEESLKSNGSSWFTATAGESLAIVTNPTAVTDKLPAGLGTFKSSEFLVLSNLSHDGPHILSIWKNMLLAVGNINQIEGSQNHAVAMQCVVDIWDTLVFVRSQQPYRNVPIPSLYEVTPWLFQATELSNAYDTGKAAAYGCLCRLMSRIPEEPISDAYYAAFYKAILNGFASNDTTIIQAILQNSKRLFSFPLPGLHILIPPFIGAIERQLLSDTLQDVSCDVKRSCITILGSLVAVSNRLKDVTIELVDEMEWISERYQGKVFAFNDIKVWLKNIFIRLVSVGMQVPQTEEDTDIHCMLLGALCALAMDELLASENPQRDVIHECILSLVNHLYWYSISIVNTICDCLNTFAQVYREDLDPDGVIVQEVLTRIIDAINVHLKYYASNGKGGRGFIISKLFSSLLEWIMVIEPIVLTETDLCQLVFDVIELALQSNLDEPVQQKKEMNNGAPFKFKLLSEKRPFIHQDLINNSSGVSDMHENDQGYVKESAEAVLLHLLHQFNNFAPPFGPATIHSTILGPGVSQDESHYTQYQYFSFNDTTIVAFVEIPATETEEAQARMIIRDLTGRYVWDTQLEPIMYKEPNHQVITEIDQRKLITKKDVVIEPSSKIIDGRNSTHLTEQDPMAKLLKHIGDTHPDCLLDPSLPLNVPSIPTAHQVEMVGNLGDRLEAYLKNEAQNNQQQTSDIRQWYTKMNTLRRQQAQDTKESMQTQLLNQFSLQKDFLPAFPQEAEKANAPFQQSRLLMSHMGFIHYNQLKEGVFQMLNKTPALYRDLRGLDRKHGRETMKIGLIYVGHGQEDEHSILQNSYGSERYKAFVNSLGWDIDIATHHGYLGGLERNLTNGTRATYYCSSTIEMIFHDVTKMPTDNSDPKQLKKKRHIGNDHVHIVWNEHDRDYRIDTIGGDFGNAQIIVSPLPNDQFSIQIYRDPKIPYFGPLFNRMIVSQAALGPLVRATAINAFRASVHTNLYSFYKSVYAQRANDVKTITQRHRVSSWSYEQFMEKIFMPEEHV